MALMPRHTSLATRCAHALREWLLSVASACFPVPASRSLRPIRIQRTQTIRIRRDR